MVTLVQCLVIIDHPFLQCEDEAISSETLNPTEENYIRLLAFVAANDHYELWYRASLFQVCPVPQKPGTSIQRLKEVIEKNCNVQGHPVSDGRFGLGRNWMRSK